MKKKSFIADLQNPAMSFISQDSIDRAEGRKQKRKQKRNRQKPPPAI